MRKALLFLAIGVGLYYYSNNQQDVKKIKTIAPTSVLPEPKIKKDDPLTQFTLEVKAEAERNPAEFNKKMFGVVFDPNSREFGRLLYTAAVFAGINPNIADPTHPEGIAIRKIWKQESGFTVGKPNTLSFPNRPISDWPLIAQAIGQGGAALAALKPQKINKKGDISTAMGLPQLLKSGAAANLPSGFADGIGNALEEVFAGLKYIATSRHKGSASKALAFKIENGWY